MAEEFQGGVCGGNWYYPNPSKNLFGSSPCSSEIFSWPINHHDHSLFIDMKTTAKSITANSPPNSASDDGDSSNNIGNIFWNQVFLHENGRSEENYSHMLNTNFCDDSSINSVTNLPLNSASYSYTSSLLQTLFDNIDSHEPPNNSNYLAEISPRLANHLQFTNNTPFWNAMAEASGDVPASFVPSDQPQFLPSSVITSKKPNPNNFSAKYDNNKEGRKLGTVAKNEPTPKRPRIETPSPLPTFKVRKEKMGDRITALQQLVSPFGKTDTASVLHEAIDYIKFLHDQVNVLSSPYLNSKPPPHRQQAADKTKDDEERQIQDLKTRGLCLVPISSTFPVTTETTTDFWTPTFGGSFR